MSQQGILKELRRRAEAAGSPAPGFKYSSSAALLQDEGHFLSKDAFTSEEQRFLLAVFKYADCSYQVQHCYINASELFSSALDLANEQSLMNIEYGEGIASTPGQEPADHATMVLNGKAVDVTWRNDTDKGNRTRKPAALLERATYCLITNNYFMMLFPAEYVRRVQNRTRVYGVICENVELLQHGAQAARPTSASKI